MGALRPGGHAAGCPHLTSGWSGAVSVCLRRHIHGLQERRRGIPASVGTAAPGAAARWPQARRVGSPDGGPSVRAQSEGHGTHGVSPCAHYARWRSPAACVQKIFPGCGSPCRPRGHATSHPAKAARPHEGPLTVQARLLHHGVLRRQCALRQGPPTPGRSRDHRLCIPEQAAPVSPVAYPRDAVDKARDRGACVPAS
jgi:hypothetical protein